MTTSYAPNHEAILAAVAKLQPLGWKVVPIEGGSERKPPMTYKNLIDLDPSDPKFIDNFKEHPECPAIAKIVDPDEIVVDIDGGEWPDMPVTPTVKTPRGFHHHFKRPKGLKMSGASLNCGDGFEVKGGGMLANIPPGLHSSGVPYTWEHGPETPMAEPPQWVIDKIDDHYAKTRTKKGKISKQEIDRLSRGVEGGERNDAMMRYGGHLIGKGKEWSEIKKP